MTTDTLQLDSNYNALVQEMKISHTQKKDTIYKNANRYKHNDIVYIPEFTSIKEIIKTLPNFPLRYKNITGTERFKIMKDYIMTFNLLQQYFSPHENNKNLIALDNRYIEKSLGSRYRNGKNIFFKGYFKLELKGIKGLYTSGYSLTEKAENEIGSYNIIIHKDKLDEVIISFLEGTFKEYKKIKTLIPKDEVIQNISDSYIEIPQRNVDAIKSFDNMYSRKILANYVDGKLYYNKDKKDYGRTYTYLHNIPKEMRNELFSGFTEIDIESAAQSILYRLAFKKIDKLTYLKKYVENKKEVRENLSKKLGYTIDEIKRLLQVITFSPNIPSKAQLSLKPSFKGLEKAIDNEFIRGLSSDLKKIDELLKLELLDFEKEILIKRNGSIKNIDVRCYKFQSIESKLMEFIQSIISKNSFHLHDAIYVDSISEQDKEEITKYLKKFEIYTSYSILDSKKYISDYASKLKSLNIEVIPLEEYQGSKTKIKHKCTCGNIWESRPGQILSGQKCKKCAVIKHKKAITKTQKEYIKELENSKSEFIPLEDYKKYSTKIKHKCSCGWEENITPRTAINKGKCNICKSLPTNSEEYIEILKRKNIKVKLIGEYKTKSTKVKHQCTCGNIWETRPFQILNGSLCQCNRVNFCDEKFYENKKTILYYLKIEDSYKIGVCLWRGNPIEDIKNRYNSEKDLNIKIISYICFSDGSLAYKREQEIKNKNKNNKALPILKSGNTELFNSINFL